MQRRLADAKSVGTIGEQSQMFAPNFFFIPLFSYPADQYRSSYFPAMLIGVQVACSQHLPGPQDCNEETGVQGVLTMSSYFC